MEEKPNYYAIIPAEVRYNPDLRPSEKLLFGEITALSNTTGICTASNNYFARLYGVSPSAITKWVSDLAKYEYIDIEYEKKGKEIIKRLISLKGTHKYDKVFTKVVEGYSQKSVENNTSINNKENNNINIITKERFKKPTLEEIETYCKERNSSVNPKTFYEYFETGNWIDSKGNKVKNWKQKLITWEKNTKIKEEKPIPSWFGKDFEEKEDKGYEDFLRAIHRDSK